MNNSSAVFISNVDDYLAPSQACVNPLYNGNSNDGDEKAPANPPPPAAVVVPRQRKRRPKVTTPTALAVVPPATTTNDPIKASIADCLACSGCVTTAETVLLEQQHSLAALKNSMAATDPTSVRVATISPAVWADLLRHLEIPASSLETWQRRLAASLQEILQVSYVLDGNIPLRWSLLESAEEFCQAYQRKQQSASNGMATGNSPEEDRIRELEHSNTPSIALNSQETNYLLPDGSTQLIPNVAVPPSLPILTSSCPALVCLAEKSSHGAVRHLCKTKSPMSLAGAWWRWQRPQHRCFHLAFMPCHDKKLEASRKDFSDRNADTQDVDMVLTTQEWFQLLVEYCQSNRRKEPGSDGGFTTTNTREEALNLVKAYLESIPLAHLQHSAEPSAILHHSAAASNPDPKVTLLLAPNPAAEQNEDAMELDDDNSKPEAMEIENSVEQSGANSSSFFTQGSGGLAEFVFRYAAWRLFGTRVDGVEWKPVLDNNTNKPGRVLSARMQRAAAKNRDYYQATLYQHTGGGFSCSPSDGSTTVLRFGIAYGLQTVQRVLEPFQQKRSTTRGIHNQNGNNVQLAEEDHPFDFVEAMACPSGCLNGGGQLRVADRETPTQTRQRVALTKNLFVTSSVALTTANSTIAQGVEDVLQIPKAERQTRFHVVPPLQHSLGAAAGVAVKDTQW